MTSPTAQAAPFALDLAARTLPVADLAAAVGRKALSLREMLLAGLPVPPATAVTTGAYAAMLATPALAPLIAAAQAATEAGRAAAHQAVAEALLTAPLPAGAAQAIAAAYQAVGAGAVAVRSSGAAEDLACASFAGMYESVLNVEGEAAVAAAVRRCWASAWNERVVAYAGHKGVAREALAMGVVIQRLVPAEVAGVLFTLDPATGLAEHMRAEACFGLGEALVAGLVTPDAYLLDRTTGAILEQTIATKAQRIDGVPGGTRALALGPEAGGAPTLGAADAQALVALGRRLQAHFRAPQDVEWAIAEGRLWLLQSRPITAITYGGVAGEWTTADFKDGGVSASVCSPYMWSLYDYVWQWSMPHYLRKIKLLRHDEPVAWGRVFYGRPYWNVGEVKRCLHRVPGFNERTFDRDLGIEGAYAGDGVVIPVNPLTIAKALPVLFALEADYKERLAKNQAFVQGFEALASRYEADPAGLEREAQVARYAALMKDDYFLTESSYFLTIYNTSNAKLDFKVELDKANRACDPPLSYLELLSGLTGLKHLAPLQDLWALAGRVRADEALTRLVTGTPAADLKEAILASPQAAFWAELAGFLHRYRHHSVAELDITQPRWDEDPTFVLATLKAYVAQFDPARDPAAAGGRQHALYQLARARAEAHFRGRGLLGRLAGRSFFAKLDLCRRYAWWREELRDCSSRMYALVRRETLALARLLAREGRLERADDEWLLTWREALALARGELAPDAAAAIVATRREDGDGWRDFVNPNELGARFKVGGGASAAAEAPPGGHSGIPCSPGRVVARARVVPTIHDADRLQAGEILVTRFTDPGWTPLFSSIAGVVTETGGILSHAAVIAREYGIPAVLAVPGATTGIADGAWITLDGAAGTIAPAAEPGA